MGRLSSLSLPGQEDIVSLLNDHTPMGEAAAGALGVAGAAGATPLAVAVPLLAHSLAEEKGVELFARADQRVDETVEDLDDERRSHRCLAAVLRGVSTVLPVGEQYSDPSLLTAEGETANLAELFQTYQEDPEYREQVEESIQHVLAGDLDESALAEEHDDFVDYLRDAFEVETRDEALAMFLDFRELLQAREVHETIEEVHDVDLDSEAIEATIETTREQLVEKLDAILGAAVRSEGFQRLNPHFFEGHEERADPVLGWRAGFRLVDVRAGYALERETEIDGERRRVTPHLTGRLQDGEDIVVLGLPGSGKSTILKSVACHWYEHQHGTVFYRERPSSKPFDEIGQLEQAIDDAEGHVLVVVEDATRDATELGGGEDTANPVFALQERYADDPTVSFLLDSRMKEWQEEDYTITDARRGVSKSRFEPFYVPQFEPDDPVEVERAVEQFEATTGVEVRTSPERLAEEIRTPLGAGEMYLLGYRLSSYVAGVGDGEETEWTGLRANGVRPVYNDLAPDDEYDTDTLPLQVGLLCSVLTAAEVDIYKEYLASLASDEDEFQRVRQILGAQRGRLHYGRNRETDAYRTNHPLWAMLFLEEGLERGDAHEELVVGAFEDAVNALFRFLEDAQHREEVAAWMDEEFAALEGPDAETERLADRIARSTFDVGIERPAVASLFGTTENSSIDFPAVCPSTTELWCRNKRGAMFMNRGSATSNTGVAGGEDEYGEFVRTDHSRTAGTQSDLERAETEFELLKEFIDAEPTLSEERLAGMKLNLGEVARARGELDAAERRLSQARDRFEEIGDADGAAKCTANLGRVYFHQQDYDAAERALGDARTQFEAIGDRHNIAMATDYLGEVAQQRGEFELACDRYEDALEVFLELEILRDAYPCLRSLLECYDELDDEQRAIEGAKRILDAAERAGTDDIADRFRKRLADIDEEQ